MYKPTLLCDQQEVLFLTRYRYAGTIAQAPRCLALTLGNHLRPSLKGWHVQTRGVNVDKKYLPYYTSVQASLD